MTNKVYGKLAPKLKKWVARYNGNLVLIDEALGMLQKMKLVDAPASMEKKYAGYVNFATAIQDADGADAFNAPIWTVPAEAFDQAKGKPKQVGATGDFTKVSLGQIKYRGGRIRFVGALLPMPTEEFDHPFGLGDYSLTYSGYQILKNLIIWQ